MMPRYIKIVIWWVIALAVASFIIILGLSLFRGGAAPTTNTQGSFNSAPNSTVVGVSSGSGTSGKNIPNATGQVSEQKVFKISDGPVAGATFIQTFHPTTTVARFVMADNGHAYDFVIDSPGAVAKPVSNTTIPGALSATWVLQGQGAVLQYLDGTTPKTVYLGLPASSTQPVRLQFYPDGIYALAASPDGSSVAYLLRTASGVDGYIAKADGTGDKKLFSLPLTQVQLRWPAPGTLLAYSSAAAGVPGIAFSISTASGTVTPLVYAAGLTATADINFDTVMYQTVSDTGTTGTYAHSVSTGTDRGLSFNPIPEKCVQSPLAAAVLYCAVPLAYVGPGFLDAWHEGTQSAADSLLSFNLAAGTSTIVAAPGGQDGGIATDMLSIGISSDGHYALFVSKYDRSLWGVRLTQ